METRTLYTILGVPRDASPRAVRTAYLALAKRLHPDCAGDEATQAFQDLHHAYEILSDPERRKEYDEELDREAGQSRAVRVAVHGASRGPMAARVVRFAHERTPPVVSDLLGELRSGWDSLHSRPTARRGTMDLEVVLSPDEAQNGVLLPFGLPVEHSCPVCGGAGHRFLLPCYHCFGQGTVRELVEVRARVPPGVRDGMIIEVPLQAIGVRGVWLRWHVRVRE